MSRTKEKWNVCVCARVCAILLGMLEGKKSLGKLRCRWVGNFKIDLREIGCNGFDWINLA
jgi:hypothetical protein